MSVTHCDECGMRWADHETPCVRELVTPHAMSDSIGPLYEAGFSACLAHIGAMPAIAVHCIKDGELDLLKPADQQNFYERQGWQCVALIYRPKP